MSEGNVWLMLMQSEIMAEPERFVEPDPELPLALLDQKEVQIYTFFFQIMVCFSVCYFYFIFY